MDPCRPAVPGVLQRDLLRDPLSVGASLPVKLPRPTPGRQFCLYKGFHEEGWEQESLEYNFPCPAGIFSFYLKFSFLSLGQNGISLYFSHLFVWLVFFVFVFFLLFWLSLTCPELQSMVFPH